MVHQVGTAEGLTFNIHRLQVYAVQLVYLIILRSVKSCHLDTRQVLVLERLRLPPVEHRLRLLLVDVHHRRQSHLVVRSNEAVDIAKLHDGTNLLIFLDGLSAECLLVVRHVLRLYLHTQASAHGYVDTILHSCGAEDGVVRRCRDVRSHRDGREEIRGAPLHVDALQGVGIVAHPELVEVRQESPVGTSATRSAGLDGQVGILFTHPLAHLLETAVVLDVQVALVVHRQILRAVIRDGHIGIPLDIVNVRIFHHQIVDNGEHEVLHLGVAQVEHHLRTASSQHGLALRSLDNPFRMGFVEFGNGIGHLRLNPDTELDAVLAGVAQQSFDTLGQLVLVDHPVTEAGIVDLAGIFVTKPSVVHHEQLATHRGNVAHHLVHALLVNVEIDAFPRVQQDFALLVAVCQHVFAAPLMEIPRNSR